jgi:hypothetical protein
MSREYLELAATADLITLLYSWSLNNILSTYNGKYFELATTNNLINLSYLSSQNNFVAYLLKARTVAPEKQPLLANGAETTFVSRQRLGKHVPAATDTHYNNIGTVGNVFSTRSMQRGWL